jgi:diadenosine tetraphosphate (Ap4A) HIT family hydrolase
MRFFVCLIAVFSLLGVNAEEKACPFCNSDVIEKQLLYEGSSAVVLYSLTPMASGHVLVIPKRHVTRFEQLSPEELLEIQSMIGKLPPIYQKVYGATDYFLMQKNGVNAGQSVPHVHFHAFPCLSSLGQIVLKAMVYNPALNDDQMHTCCETLRPYFQDP